MKNNEHEKFMRIAISLSEKNVNENLGGPFGAVITKNGKLIAKSANKVNSILDPTAHAEIATIRLACKKLKTIDLAGCILYTSAEPCPMCLGAVYWSKIDVVFYANSKVDSAKFDFDDEFIYKEFAKPMNKRTLGFKQLLRDEAQNAFKLWELSEMKTD